MTDALHDRALVMAREIAAESLCRGEAWLPGVKAGIHEEIIAGKHDTEPLVQGPFAAILATTERAAALIDGHHEVHSNKEPYRSLAKRHEGDLLGTGYSDALRSAAHLKDPS